MAMDKCKVYGFQSFVIYMTSNVSLKSNQAVMVYEIHPIENSIKLISMSHCQELLVESTGRKAIYIYMYTTYFYVFHTNFWKLKVIGNMILIWPKISSKISGLM